MSSTNKKSTSLLRSRSQNSIRLKRHGSDGIVNSDNVSIDKQFVDNKLEKQFKRMSILFHKSKTENSSLHNSLKTSMNTSDNKLNSKNVNDIPDEVPLPQVLNNNSFYSLQNTSSGTLISHNLSVDTSLNNGNQINSVEFTNVRTGSGYYDNSDSIHSPSSASLLDKTKETKLVKFFNKTGHKVKKFSDLNSEHFNVGLGLHGHNNNHNHNHNRVYNHVFPELHLKNTFFNNGLHNKDVKSPVIRNFNKNDTKLTFGEKLKLLNSSKYKNYHYHNLLRNKKESLKNGIKLGSKSIDLLSSNNYDNMIAGSSYALYDVDYIEIERMLAKEALNFEQCESYCKFLYQRIQYLLMPLFKGEILQVSIEDITKLVSLYVRLRKAQDATNDFEKPHDYKSNNSNNGNISNNNNILIGNSQSQYSLNSGNYDDYETPFMKPNATFSDSPLNANLSSPNSFSPLIKIRSTSYSAISKVLDELNDMLKIGMTIMINQLYYDESNDCIRFIRGMNPILNKRKNTISSTTNNDENPDYMDSSHNISVSSHLMYGGDSGLNSSTKSVPDLPILTPTPTQTPISTTFNNVKDMESNIGDNQIDVNPTALEFHEDLNVTSLNLGLLPAGKFEKCTSILWDMFQRHVIFELSSILLPIELEFANGHRKMSKVHNRANSILYNNGEKLRSFTNTMVYPDISGNDSNDKYKYKYNNSNNNNNNKNDDDDVGIIGSIGEWTDINIRSVLLVGFRNYVVIPLYEMNRKYEDIEGVTREDDYITGFNSGIDTEINNNNNNNNNGQKMIEDFNDAFLLLQCFRTVCSVSTNDTNQKLVENLLVQMRDKCRSYEVT